MNNTPSPLPTLVPSTSFRQGQIPDRVSFWIQSGKAITP
jgi:hypothetical protein